MAFKIILWNLKIEDNLGDVMLLKITHLSFDEHYNDN